MLINCSSSCLLLLSDKINKGSDRPDFLLLLLQVGGVQRLGNDKSHGTKFYLLGLVEGNSRLESTQVLGRDSFRFRERWRPKGR